MGGTQLAATDDLLTVACNRGQVHESDLRRLHRAQLPVFKMFESEL